MDKRADVDLGDPAVQRIVKHYLHNCHVLVLIVQPNCRTTGRPSYFNAQVNYTTWLKHHNEDLPHIKFCGTAAIIQDNLGRYFLREQPTGTWVDQIDPWPTLANKSHIAKTNIDQCATGLKTADGMYIKKPTEIMSNDTLLLQPFRRFKCSGDHKHGSLVTLKTLQ